MTDKGYKPYKPSFMLMFALLFLLATASGAGSTAAMEKLGLNPHPIRSYAFLRLLCIIYLWAALGALIIAQTLAIRVTQGGIHGRTFWGRARYIAWEDMTTAAMTRTPPLRFMCLGAEDGRAPLWVPWFIRKRGLFRQDVLAKVAEDHPLRNILAPEGP